MEKIIKFNHKNLELQLNSEADLSVFEEIFVDKDYKILDTIITKASNCILDIGAHIGLFSIYCHCLNPQVPMLAFEPEEKNFQTLKENFRHNSIKNVLAKNLAVSASEGPKTLYLSPDSHNHSLIDVTNQSKIVQSTTLEQIIKKHNLSKIDLLKLDCEGAEFEILENCPKEIFNKVQNLYIEYHIYQPNLNADKILSKLQKANFKVQTKPSHYDKKFGFIFAHAIS